MLTDADHAALDLVAARLAGDPSVLFVTGAGVSADSGLPTYRGVGGLYDDADTADGVPIEEALSGAMFRRRPEVTWRYLHQLGRAASGGAPNRAHDVIAALQRRLSRVVVLTQNVDGLHGRAGADALEVHGSAGALVCPACGWREALEDWGALPPLPRCPACAAVVRPPVVLFGELLPAPTVRRLVAELDRGFDVVVAVGTSAVFPYVQEPVLRARDAGGLTVEINPGDTPLSALVSLRVRAGAAEALGALGARLGLP